MARTSPRRPLRAAGVGLVVGALALSVAATAAPGRPAAPSSSRQLTPAQLAAVGAGFQLAVKGSANGKPGAPSANPYLAYVPDLTQVDYATWKNRLAELARQRASSSTFRSARAAANRVTPAQRRTIVWDEQEPDGTSGSNDTLATAELVTMFGTGAGEANAVRILGQDAELAGGSTRAIPPVAEDNGAIPLAGATGLTGAAATRTTSGVLGDGPHGPSGDGTNDFDYYKVSLRPGLGLVADTSGSVSGIDTILAVYDASGELVASDDDGGTTRFTSLAKYTSDTGGTYYVAVGGYSTSGSLPGDPFDSGSGAGGGDTGDYNLSLAVAAVDRDNYAVDLEPGDVIGGVTQGEADALTVYRPDGTQMIGSTQSDASFLYPPESPLPGGGTTTMAYVAEQAGRYVISVGGDVGAYEVQLEGYRPGAERDPNQTQTVFLDFEGGRVNTGIWGGAGVRELSPFSAFLAKWGIPRSSEDATIAAVTAEVRRNVAGEVRALNPGLRVRVVNSRNHPEVEGKANVSRVVVAGTIDESGIPTIGIAQFIDPGNYAHTDAALVLLDVMSDPGGADNPASLNTYLRARSDRVAFVSQAVGNVVSHEIGHLVGNYHTDNQSAAVNLEDSGGANFQNLFGVGPDGVGGTADDANVRFVQDIYSPVEGFTGQENTRNVTAWAWPSP